MKSGISSWDSLPWKQLYSYITKCGSHHDIRSFSMEILNGLSEFVSFDRGLVYFIDGNHKIHNQYLVNFKDNWSNLYTDYYSKASFNKFSIQNRIIQESVGRPYVNIIKWYEEPDSDFMTDYIKAQNLQLTLAFVLFDLNGEPRVAFALDRLHQVDFTSAELDILKVVIPSLNNLHKNFYAKPYGDEDAQENVWESAGLTQREIEIANLMCQGVSPNNISSALHIAVSTTYKHIAHIYEKMKVSSQQELLVKVMQRQK